MPVTITIIGLGPGLSSQWTARAAQILDTARTVYLRTPNHPSVVDIAADTHSFDHLYQTDGPAAVAAELVRIGSQQQSVVFAVPGDPRLSEATVARLQAHASDPAIDLTLEIVPGPGVLYPALSALELAGLAQLQLADAAVVAHCHHPPLEPDRPTLITHLHGVTMAANVQRGLLNAFPASFEVTLVQQLNTTKQRIRRFTLEQVAVQPELEEYGVLYLPADTARSGFSSFQNIIAHLRAPDGCPWDQEQTHQTLRANLVEEAYEVLEAIDAGDVAALAEELGDLLLQILLHTQIATDTGEFKMRTVIDQIHRKMVRRHPHVFGDTVIEQLDELMQSWESIKKAEKAAKGTTAANPSALDGVPKGLPALAEAMKISKKAVRVGFEWPNIDGVLDKIVEEAQEVADATEPTHLESEIGDLLFSVVNLARWRGIDAESALRSTNARFVRRFQAMEQLATADGLSFETLSLDEMERLWRLAKQGERTPPRPAPTQT